MLSIGKTMHLPIESLRQFLPDLVLFVKYPNLVEWHLTENMWKIEVKLF